jgi:uncharacterized membrane protein
VSVYAAFGCGRMVWSNRCEGIPPEKAREPSVLFREYFARMASPFHSMALLGRIHPLVIHFPIALVLIAACAELIATFSGRLYWRTVAVANVRAGAAFGVIAAIAGWFLPRVLGLDSTALLEWHRWLGTLAALCIVAAALVSAGADRRSPMEFRLYRLTLFSAAALVAVTGHLGGLLVWGPDLLRAVGGTRGGDRRQGRSARPVRRSGSQKALSIAEASRRRL